MSIILRGTQRSRIAAHGSSYLDAFAPYLALAAWLQLSRTRAPIMSLAVPAFSFLYLCGYGEKPH